MAKKLFICVLVLFLLSMSSGCDSTSRTSSSKTEENTSYTAEKEQADDVYHTFVYTRINDQKHTFVLDAIDNNNGTFVEYFDGEIISEKYIRNEWKIIDDILILNDNEERFKIYDDCIIRFEEGCNELEDYKYIAPKGDTFDFDIDSFHFYSNGTYSYLGYSGCKYYKNGNIIYMDFPWDESQEYLPKYYMYDNDHIIDAFYVYTYTK